MSELKAQFLCGLDNARKSNFCCYVRHILHNDFGEWKMATPMDKLEDAEINRIDMARYRGKSSRIKCSTYW